MFTRIRHLAKSLLRAAETDWDIRDQHRALEQGWGLYEVVGKGELQLQRCDEADRFKDDAEAWRFVHERAEWGDPLAAKAMNVLRASSPTEYGNICRYSRIAA